ncbi:MAG: hypothetical protein ABR540_15940 [Acidimicrobiales bacterium]
MLALLGFYGTLLGGCAHDCETSERRLQFLLALGVAAAGVGVGLLGALAARAGWRLFGLWLIALVVGVKLLDASLGGA